MTTESTFSIPPERMAYPDWRKQMMTIDSEIISGVPFTGLLKITRPLTSATTKKHNMNARMAAKTIKALVTQSLTRVSIEDS
jgi:hypothetical protein